MATSTDALAQDYTTGALRGVVANENGEPVSGAQVTVRSESQGFVRNSTTNSQGEFTLQIVPTGDYTVSISAPGYAPTESRGVRVVASQSNTYAFDMAATGGGSGDEIVVTAARSQLSFNETTTGIQLDVQELASRIPVGQNALALTLLAPTAIQGGAANKNAAFAGQAAIGGASVAENAFYVNGLNITNFDNYLGASLVPFEFYDTIEVKTGGYSAEFGRATGGVINAVTKSGSNDFMVRLSGNWDSDEFREDAPRTMNDANEFDASENQNLTLEVGGPIIRDRLFFYVLGQYRDNENEFASITARSFNIDRTDDPFYAGKIDFNITDDHRIEATFFDTTRETTREIYGFTPALGSGGTIGAAQPGLLFQEGGESYVVRYTGSFTDWFTLSAGYGENSDSDSVFGESDAPLVTDTRQGGVRLSQTQSLGTNDPIERERTFYRVDADFFFDLAGEHHVRVGWDKEELGLNHIAYRTGGGGNVVGTGGSYIWRAGFDPFLNDDGDVVSNAQGQLAGQNYIERNIFDSGGAFEQVNQSYYIQDSWDILDNLTINLGVRLDQFNIANAEGVEFSSFDEEIGPRLGFSWDPANDGANRVYGSFGRYYLPIAANTAFRMGATELYFREYFQVGDNGTPYNPVDPENPTPAELAAYLDDYDPVTGMPVGGFGTQITQANAPGGTFNASICPTAVGGSSGASAVSPGADACSVTGDGTTSVPAALVAQNLESTYEDEFILGWEHRFDNDWTIGLSGIWRTLGRTAEDSAIDAAVLAYCDDNAIAGCSSVWTGFHQYVIMNPGSDLTVILDGGAHPLDGQTITLSAEDLGYPTAQRDYYAATFEFERPWDGQWMLQGSYTLSLAEGNFEGQVKSDVGQDDVGITQDFDQPGLVDNSYGLLPNHRAHQFKLFGAYALTESFTIGANATVISPRHFGCIGLHPTDFFAQQYGAAAFYCNGEDAPRGSVMESDWTTQLDLSFRYSLPEAVPGELTLRADIFNIFNSDAVTSVEEVGENGDGSVANLNAAHGGGPRYGFPTSYQTPRFVRVGFAWEF